MSPTDFRDLTNNDLWRESLKRSRGRRSPGSRARATSRLDRAVRIPEAQAMGLAPRFEPRDLTSVELWDKSILRSQHRRRMVEQARASRKPVRRAGAMALGAATVFPAATGVATADNSSSAAATQSTAPNSTVASVQRALGIASDGIYGPETQHAVRSYQRAHGLSVDGIVGPQTLGSLGLSGASATTASASGHGGAATVTSVQSAVGVSADGVFGPQTAAAVKHYQAAHGLTADGIVGPATAQAMGMSAPSSPLREEHHHHASAHSSSGSSSSHSGSGSVSDVQHALGIPADGNFGPQTAEAVKHFQAAHGLTSDGIVGPSTAQALGIDAPSTPLREHHSSSSSGSGSSSDATSSAMSRMVAAANQIADLPYVWGGGHGSFQASGYDCSGSVSFVLHAGGLLSSPEDSSALEGYGASGPGQHITIYANAGHAWMTIDGRRFDTGGGGGSRWKSAPRSGAGFVVRHPVGF
jgi:peptidoglycan hydrolase-like protein with peptidoglycan-binding domain